MVFKGRWGSTAQSATTCVLVYLCAVNVVLKSNFFLSYFVTACTVFAHTWTLGTKYVDSIRTVVDLI